ncbi:MAG: hypothetical protein HONBIEJF_02710 [Fimbriimonadaceae bacterium]|nr:hypothetical protein [Fimbriimonadaceae bacterium]
MMDSPFARVALWTAPDDPWARFERDAIHHAGLLVEELAPVGWHELEGFDALILAGKGVLNAEQAAAAMQFAQRGPIIASGCHWGIGSTLGIRPDPNLTLARSELELDGRRIRFFGGSACWSAGAEVLSLTGTGHVARARHGRATFFAPRVGETIGRMLLGRSVEATAICPNDRSAEFFRSTLHAEDGALLDFETDRHNGHFGIAHGDSIRTAWITTILEALKETGKSPVLAWHWPDNAEAVASVAIQCRECSAINVEKAQRLLAMLGSQATFLVAPPGYPLDIYRQLKRSGHEVGLLFLADDGSTWTEERFKVQHLAISRTASIPHLVSARPADSRWWRLDRFYRMVEVAGTRLSLGKGGIQSGTSGFLFGTCHPTTAYGPVVELPQIVFRPGAATSDFALEPLLDEVVRQYGCYSMVFETTDMQVPVVSDSIRHAMTIAHQRRLPMLAPDTIYRFEKARRSLEWSREGGRLIVGSASDLEGLTLLFAEGIDLTLDHREANTKGVKRYGQSFQALTLNFAAKATHEIGLTPVGGKKAA